MHGRIIDFATHALNGTSASRGTSTNGAVALAEDDAEGELGAARQERLDYVFSSTCAHSHDPETPIAHIRCRVVVDPARGWQLVRLADDGCRYERVMRGTDAREQQLIRDALALLLDLPA